MHKQRNLQLRARCAILSNGRFRLESRKAASSEERQHHESASGVIDSRKDSCPPIDTRGPHQNLGGQGRAESRSIGVHPDEGTLFARHRGVGVKR